MFPAVRVVNSHQCRTGDVLVPILEPGFRDGKHRVAAFARTEMFHSFAPATRALVWVFEKW